MSPPVLGLSISPILQKVALKTDFEQGRDPFHFQTSSTKDHKSGWLKPGRLSSIQVDLSRDTRQLCHSLSDDTVRLSTEMDPLSVCLRQLEPEGNARPTYLLYSKRVKNTCIESRRLTVSGCSDRRICSATCGHHNTIYLRTKAILQ